MRPSGNSPRRDSFPSEGIYERFTSCVAHCEQHPPFLYLPSAPLIPPFCYKTPETEMPHYSLFCSLSFQRTTTVSARGPWTHTISTSPPSESRFSSPFATVSSPSARSLVSKWLSGEGACRMAWMGSRPSHVQQRLLKFCTHSPQCHKKGGDSRPLCPAAKRLKGSGMLSVVILLPTANDHGWPSPTNLRDAGQSCDSNTIPATTNT